MGENDDYAQITEMILNL